MQNSYGCGQIVSDDPSFVTRTESMRFSVDRVQSIVGNIFILSVHSDDEHLNLDSYSTLSNQYPYVRIGGLYSCPIL